MDSRIPHQFKLIVHLDSHSRDHFIPFLFWEDPTGRRAMSPPSPQCDSTDCSAPSPLISIICWFYQPTSSLPHHFFFFLVEIKLISYSREADNSMTSLSLILNEQPVLKRGCEMLTTKQQTNGLAWLWNSCNTFHSHKKLGFYHGHLCCWISVELKPGSGLQILFAGGKNSCKQNRNDHWEFLNQGWICPLCHCHSLCPKGGLIPELGDCAEGTRAENPSPGIVPLHWESKFNPKNISY